MENLSFRDWSLMHPRIPRRVIAILTAKAFDTSLSEVRSSSRLRTLFFARCAVWYMVKELRPETSWEQLGDLLNKDHTTAIHGLDRAKGLAELNRDFIARLHRARDLIAQWHPGEAQAAERKAALVPIAKTIETPPAREIEPREPSYHGSPAEYDSWFKASCKRSEERFLRIASAIHPERVRVPVKEAAE